MVPLEVATAMSRGPGKWQRAVISACAAEAPGWLTVEQIADDHFVSVDPGTPRSASTLTDSEREAIRRAIRRLAEDRVIESGHHDGHLVARVAADLGEMLAQIPSHLADEMRSGLGL